MRSVQLSLYLILISFVGFAQNKNYDKGIKAFSSKDFNKAFTLLKPFADAGDPMAEFIVGFCYENSDSRLKNDVLAEKYLLSSAGKYNAKAMALLSLIYFDQGMRIPDAKVQALFWAELAAAYDPVYSKTTTRILIRNYLSENQLKQAEALLENNKLKFDKINLETFRALNKQSRFDNENSEKVIIPENKHGLMEDPYQDWVYRWKLERFQCDTMYYTAQIDTTIINSTIKNIKQKQSFEIHYLYRGQSNAPLKISRQEQDFLVNELEKLKNLRWEAGMFPHSKCIQLQEIQTTLDKAEQLPTEGEKNMCAIVYTFSKPILFRDQTIALFLDQKRYRGNYTQLDFSFYKLENDQWELFATVYQYYESR